MTVSQPAVGAATERVRVVVATTEGPVEIRRLTAEDPDLRSVVCLAGTSQTLSISNAYDAFVRAPTGVIERAVGHPVFRMDVDRPIDDGESWQLGVYLAHRLKAVGRLAEDGVPAERIVWATGRVDHDGRVGGVGWIDAKLRRSEGLPAVQGMPVLAVLPFADRDRIDESVAPVGFEFMLVDRVDTVVERLGFGNRRSTRTGHAGRVVTWLGAAGITAAAIVLSWPTDVGIEPPRVVDSTPSDAVLPERASTENTLVAAPSAVSGFDPTALRLTLEERRLQIPGAQCVDAGTLIPVEPGAEAVAGGCALRWSVENAGAVPANIWLYAVIEGTFREYVSRTRSSELANGRLEPGAVASVTVAPPPWLRRTVTARAILVIAADERPQIDQVFDDIDLASSNDLDRKVAGLIDLDVRVVDRRHLLIPPAR